jgi:hypothetical protein
MENSEHVGSNRQTVGQTVRHKDRITADTETLRDYKEARTWFQTIWMEINAPRVGLTKIRVDTDSINTY